MGEIEGMYHVLGRREIYTGLSLVYLKVRGYLVDLSINDRLILK